MTSEILPNDHPLFPFQEKRGIRKLDQNEQLNELNLPTLNFNIDIYQEDHAKLKSLGINISKFVRILIHRQLQTVK